jgi:hypothetical protein
MVLLGLRGSGRSASWLDALLPAGALDRVLGSPWLVMALATGALLLALNTWLNARLPASRLR